MRTMLLACLLLVPQDIPTFTGEGPPPAPVTLHAIAQFPDQYRGVQVVDWVAIMEATRAPDGDWHGYGVRLYEPESETSVRHARDYPGGMFGLLLDRGIGDDVVRQFKRFDRTRARVTITVRETEPDDRNEYGRGPRYVGVITRVEWIADGRIVATAP